MVPIPDTQSAPARILVIEDEVLVRALVADALRDAGFTVIEASNADDALAYVTAGGEVDLVFSDIRMPGPVSGLELARQLRDRHPSLPIILTSGSHGPDSVDTLGQYLPKPYNIEHAISMVFKALGLEPPAARDD
jgi:CheY-like chemotaxis protein